MSRLPSVLALFSLVACSAPDADGPVAPPATQDDLYDWLVSEEVPTSAAFVAMADPSDERPFRERNSPLGLEQSAANMAFVRD